MMSVGGVANGWPNVSNRDAGQLRCGHYNRLPLDNELRREFGDDLGYGFRLHQGDDDARTLYRDIVTLNDEQVWCIAVWGMVRISADIQEPH